MTKVRIGFHEPEGGLYESNEDDSDHTCHPLDAVTIGVGPRQLYYPHIDQGKRPHKNGLKRCFAPSFLHLRKKTPPIPDCLAARLICWDMEFR
jgi:hypothetical protein